MKAFHQRLTAVNRGVAALAFNVAAQPCRSDGAFLFRQATDHARRGNRRISPELWRIVIGRQTSVEDHGVGTVVVPMP